MAIIFAFNQNFYSGGIFPDFVTGTPFGDQLDRRWKRYGLRLDGNDTILGGTNEDQLFGGDDNDLINGEAATTASKVMPATTSSSEKLATIPSTAGPATIVSSGIRAST